MVSLGRCNLGNIYPWSRDLGLIEGKTSSESMSTSERIEQLAAAIAEDVYIDIAKWHLYLNDAHLHRPLAEKFYPLLLDGITAAAVTKVLNETAIAIGGGKREIPLSDLIPSSCQNRLLTVLEEFERAL